MGLAEKVNEGKYDEEKQELATPEDHPSTAIKKSSHTD
jgi:hypothetical protein